MALPGRPDTPTKLPGRGILVGIILPLVVCASYLVAHFQKERALLNRIREIPLEDRMILEDFFRVLILKEGGAYVLFGDKPMAFTAYLHSPQPNLCTTRTWQSYIENQKIKKGWEVWKKYRGQFPSRRFILDCRTFDERRSEICLIDAGKLQHIVKDNLADFQSVLGRELTPLTLLKEYQQEESPFFGLVKGHHALLGICLGFGKMNSWLFHEHAEGMGEDPNKVQPVSLKMASMRVPSPKTYPLTSVFRESNHRKCFKFLYLPLFAADLNSPETVQLQKRYLCQQQKIHEAYAHENFLEVTLKRFCFD